MVVVKGGGGGGGAVMAIHQASFLELVIQLKQISMKDSYGASK